MAHPVVVGLDVGSQTIKAALLQIGKDGELLLRALIKGPSAGIRRGIVEDVRDATRALNDILLQLKPYDRDALKNIFLGVGSDDIKVHASRGIVAVSRADSEIHRDDIDRAIEASQAIKLLPNRAILHSVIQEFIVDDVDAIRDPSGMVGSRLEVRSLIIDGFGPHVKNLTKCIETCGGRIAGYVCSPLASARAVLSKNQRELGTLLIDIGYGRTGFAVFEENQLLTTAVIPFGSGHVTNDVAVGLRSSVAVADHIKLSLGVALTKEAPARELVDLKKFDPALRGTVSRRFIAEIIERRFAEIFELIQSELKRIGRAGRLPGGAVITGGGSKIPALVDLASHELKLSAQLGIPDTTEFRVEESDLSLRVDDTDLSCVVGLALSGADRLRGGRELLQNEPIWKRLLKHFLP